MLTADEKSAEYREYLENAGVIRAIDKAIVKLYGEEEKPDDAVRFVRKYMSDSCPDDDNFETLKTDCREALRKVTKLELDIERCKVKVKEDPEVVTEKLETGFKELTEDKEKKNSLLYKYLKKEIFEEYKTVLTPAPVEASLYDCLKSGFAHHDSSCGIYAADPQCYDIYNKLFDPIIRDFHDQLKNEKSQLQPATDFGKTDKFPNLDKQSKYIVSTRMRLARNIEGFPYFAKLTERQFIEIEEKVKESLKDFKGEWKGTYLSLKDIADERQEEMVEQHKLFKKGDQYLYDAGCYRFWDIGRGIFHTKDFGFIVWVNEEDHLRIISLSVTPTEEVAQKKAAKTSTPGDISVVYKRLVDGLKALEKTLVFGRHTNYGNLTVCPTNLGTTLRISVHIRLPLLAKNEKYLKKMCKNLKLQIRGTHGEHTNIQDGLMDISNSRRLGMTEYELVKSFHEGITALIKVEQDLEKGKLPKEEKPKEKKEEEEKKKE